MALPVLPGLSFALGELIKTDAAHLLGLPICYHESKPSPFALVVAFGRCKFRLNPSSIGVILQATIGGFVALFRVSQLLDRTFKFFVSSRQVGFSVVNLRSFSCDFYSLTFHLWGNNGPNWRREFALFLAEEERSWHSAPRRHAKPQALPHASAFARPGKSFADAIRSKPACSVLAPPLTRMPMRYLCILVLLCRHSLVLTPSRCPLNGWCSIVFNLRSWGPRSFMLSVWARSRSMPLRPPNLTEIALGTDPCFHSINDVCLRVIIEHLANAQSGAMLAFARDILLLTAIFKNQPG